MRAKTESGFEFEPLYTPSALAGWDYATKLNDPGQYPYTRGVHPTMYTTRPWTMRQYAGFGNAEESNARYKELIAAGTTGLSVAFDLPTQMGFDSDNPICEGEVGKVGVAIDSLDDMRRLFDGLPLDQVSTSMTINAPASIMLLLYELVAAEQGVPAEQLTGTLQNDILKEYTARGTYIFPPAPSLRLISDVFAYCHDNIPKWNTISISGYHMVEAGATPAQEVAFTIADGIAYVEAGLKAGLQLDDFAPRLSFFFIARSHLLEEVAKFRAARRVWAKIIKERFGSNNPKSQMMRFHVQNQGSSMQAQQPEVNIVRTTIQALAAVMGGTQSLHTTSYDEALSLPSAKAARLSVRTQQVIAYETDICAVVDPWAGSYALESLTDKLTDEVWRILDKIDELGGAIAAVEQGYQVKEMSEAAFQYSQDVDAGKRIIVGVNKFVTDETEPFTPQIVDPTIGVQQTERIAALKARRDNAAVAAALAQVRETAAGTANLLYPMKTALKLGATVGEVCDALRAVWGVFKPEENL